MDWKNKIDNIISKVKFQFHARGIDDLEALHHFFAECDKDRSGYLDYNEFNKMIAKIGLFLTSQELSCVYREFDANNDGRIPFLEFIQRIRTSISAKRLEVVKQAWNFLNPGRRPAIPIAELLKAYRAEEHPRVRTRAKTVEQVRDEFVKSITAHSRDHTNITEGEFIEYYMDLNATLPPEKELYFVDIVFRTWGMSAEAGYITPERLTHLEGILYEKIRQRTLPGEDEGKTVKKAFKYFDLEDKGVITMPQFAAALESFGCTFAQGEVAALFSRFDKDRTGKIVFDEFSSYFALLGAGTNKNINPVFQLTRELPEDVLIKVKNDLLRRGEHGIRGLGKVFKRCDKNKSGGLDRAEFAWAMKENGHNLTKFELDKLYKYFDKNCDNFVSYDEFLRVLRGDLNEKRRGIINKAFEKLNITKTGKVTIEDIKKLYDASAHPEVKRGVKRPEDILRDFLGQFDTIQKDGIVTLAEFEEYYRDLSASIDNDDLFVEFVRRAWKLD